MAMPSRSLGTNFRTLLCLGLGWLATTATAQSTTTPSSASSSTSSAPSVTHTVAVAADAFSFEPNSIEANVSDIILFEFYQGNHSVARAEYTHPCIPYENLGGGRVGFWSGFEPVEGIPQENGPKFALRINSTEPIFFYCSAPGACVPNGMIGVINPNKTQTLATQELFVKNASFQLSPGEAPPSESTGTPTSSSSSATSSAASSGSSSGGGGGGLSKGAIAGIVVGAVVVIALAALTFYLCGRNRTLASVVRYSQPPQPKHPPAIPPPMPYSPGSPHANDPYTPSFADNHSPKPALVASPNLNHHDSWQSQPPMAAVSPGFAGQSPYGGQPSPGHAPWSPGGFAAPPQGQYSPVPQQAPYHPHQEMATGQEHNLTPSASPGPYAGHPHDSYMTAQSHLSGTVSPPPAPAPQNARPIFHEMDAAPTVPPTSPPPEYVGRSFSFAQGGSAEAPGVEKVLRE